MFLALRELRFARGRFTLMGIVIALISLLVVMLSGLLVDEPTAALDRRRSHEVVQLLADRAHQSGVTVVMVTHDRDVLEHCDSVLEMVDGRLGAPALVA